MFRHFIYNHTQQRFNQHYREFPVKYVAGSRHPAYSETEDDEDHSFRDVDFRL